MSKLGSLATLLYARFARGDRQAGFVLLRRLGRLLYPDYRFLDPRLDWWEDQEFNRYLERFDERDSLNNERKLMVAQLLRLTRGIEGNTAECGVFRGATSYLICASNRGTDKLHHLFDSFAGLSAPGAEDGDHWQGGDLAVPLDEVRRNLSEFEQVRFHPGWIPDKFSDVEGESFSFVHIDVDLLEPTMESIRFFYPRVRAGGILVCDDYGFLTCPGATKAVDDFLADKPEKMISLPGGGGFLIKGTPTAERDPS